MTTTFLTKEGYQKLADELEFLRVTKRQEVANRLHEAMEGGELIENAEYEAAKNEQAFVEGRIQEVEMILASARVIDEKKKKEKGDEKEIGKKSWWLNGRQLFQIMGNTHQTPLGIHFILPSQMESAEAHIMFHNAKHGLHFGGALCT